MNLKQIYLQFAYSKDRSPDSAVGIATHYGLDGPEANPGGGGGKLSAPVQTGSETHPTTYTMGTGSFLGVMQPERGINHRPQRSIEVKERVGLYFYSPSGPSWPVIG